MTLVRSMSMFTLVPVHARAELAPGEGVTALLWLPVIGGVAGAVAGHHAGLELVHPAQGIERVLDGDEPLLGDRARVQAARQVPPLQLEDLLELPLSTDPSDVHRWGGLHARQGNPLAIRAHPG